MPKNNKSLAKIKASNLASIVHFVMQQGKCTKREIQYGTLLSWGSVSGGVKELTELGVLSSIQKNVASSHGRSSDTVTINPKKVLVIGIDIIRSNLRGVLLNLNREVVWESEAEELNETRREPFLKKIIQKIHSLIEVADQKEGRVIAIGCSVSGEVDAKKGISHYISGFEDDEWRDVPLKEVLEKHFSLPVFLEHDPQCVLHNEIQKRGINDAILIRMGQGLGCAICLDGKILSGRGRYEITFFRVQTDKGQLVPLEDVASVWGTVMRKNKDLDMQDVINDIPRYSDSFSSLGSGLGEALFNLECLFKTNNIILTGPLAAHRELYLDDIKNRINNLAHRPLTEEITFFIDEKDDAASGAAMIALKQSLTSFLSKTKEKTI